MAFCKPIIDGLEQGMGGGFFALCLPICGQAGCGAQLQRPGLLAAGHFKGAIEVLLHVLYGRMLGRGQQSGDAVDLGLPTPFSGCMADGLRLLQQSAGWFKFPGAYYR